MKELRFYKEFDGRWYVDLPNWPGTKSDLEMVSGADVTLEFIGNGNDTVILLLSEEYFENANKLEYVRHATEYDEGAFYKIDTYRGTKIKQDIWLCDVMKFVFGDFPKLLYISDIN